MKRADSCRSSSVFLRLVSAGMAIHFLFSMQAPIFALAPQHSKKTEIEMNEQAQELSAKEFIQRMPILRRWTESNPDMVERFGHKIWEDVYRKVPIEHVATVFTDIPLLEDASFVHLQSKDDVWMYVETALHLENLMRGRSYDLFTRFYERSRRAFGVEPKGAWLKLLKVMAASAGDKRGMAAYVKAEFITGVVLDLFGIFGERFKMYLPLLCQTIEAGDEDVLVLLCETLKEHPPEENVFLLLKFTQILTACSLLRKHTKNIPFFVRFVVPVVALHKKSNTGHWAAACAIASDLNKAEREAMEMILTQYHPEIKRLRDMTDLSNAIKQLMRQFGNDRGVLAWWLKRKVPQLAKNVQATTRLLQIIDGHLGHGLRMNLPPFLQDVQIQTLEDFESAVAATRGYIQSYPKGPEADARLRFTGPWSVLDYVCLYEEIARDWIPITAETYETWEAVRDRAGLPKDITGLPVEQRLTRMRKHYAQAIHAFHSRWWPYAQNDFTSIPARLIFSDAAEAERFAVFSDGHPKIFRAGTLSAPNGRVLRKGSLFPTEQEKAHQKLFAGTTNLISIPTRHPLKYRLPTVHNRSVVIAKGEGADHVAKGEGTAEWHEKDGVVALFTKGAGVHNFFGGLDAEEIGMVREAERRMKKSFRKLLKDPLWKALAEFFRVTEKNLFISHMAECQPLALPVYFKTPEARKKFEKHILDVPGFKPTMGVELVRPQPLLDHMGVGTLKMSAPWGNARTGQVQRIHLYKTPEMERIAEMEPPEMNESGEAAKRTWPHLKYLPHLGIRAVMGDAKSEKPYRFYDNAGKELSDRYVRQYVFFGWMVRTGMLLQILHDDLKASGQNDWGTIFTALNMSPITVFDYDTVALPEDSRYSPEQIAEFQKSDISALTDDDGTMLSLFNALGGDECLPKQTLELMISAVAFLFPVAFIEEHFPEEPVSQKLLSFLATRKISLKMPIEALVAPLRVPDDTFVEAAA